jgi:acyl-CoA hydrolase
MSSMIDLRRHLRPGDTVLLGQGSAEPRSLLEALIEQRHSLAPLRLFVGTSFTSLLRAEHTDAIQVVSFGALGTMSDLAREDRLTVLPVHLATVPQLIAEGRLRFDAVMAQISPAGADGVHSLGLVSDLLRPAIDTARVVLGEVNPNVPFTFGDTSLPAARIAELVHDDRPLISVDPRPTDAVGQRIAELIAPLIPDGATLQIGVGGLQDSILGRLTTRSGLGIHSGLISDAVLDLIELGVMDNARKPIDQGISVTGALFGTSRLYKWAHRNPRLSMRSVAYTHDTRVLSSLPAFHALNSAIEVDLTGQVNAEAIGDRYVGAIGGHGTFSRAGLLSPGGRSIVALPSCAGRSGVSRIVTRLPAAITTTSRADADIVVTEHGVADLRGASIEQRVERMLAIAHPGHRGSLEHLWRHGTG